MHVSDDENQQVATVRQHARTLDFELKIFFPSGLSESSDITIFFNRYIFSIISLSSLVQS